MTCFVMRRLERQLPPLKRKYLSILWLTCSVERLFLLDRPQNPLYLVCIFLYNSNFNVKCLSGLSLTVYRYKVLFFFHLNFLSEASSIPTCQCIVQKQIQA